MFVQRSVGPELEVGIRTGEYSIAALEEWEVSFRLHSEICHPIFHTRLILPGKQP